MISPKNIVFFALFCCFTSIVTAQTYITVDDYKTAADLVNLLTNNSSCLNLSNQTVKGDTFTSGKNSFGTFNQNSSGFPFDKGIVLSTWSSVYSVGPFVREPSNTTKSGSSNWNGDIDLENALKKGNTQNATFLEFDFMPQTDYLSFNYIFASNEYQDDFPCNYSDGFAFLIKENTPGATYKNLAVLSDGTAISSQNVHPAINFNTTKCDAINTPYFGQLNTNPTNTSPIDYSGQTKILTAQTAVKAGTSYHIKLVIADQNGNYYDSAVFIEAGSFSSKIDLGQNQLVSTNNPVCFGESVKLDTGLTGGSYKWYNLDNSSTIPISGQTSSTLPVNTAGTYKVEATLSGCTATGEIKIEYAPKIQLTDTSLVKCDDNGNGTATFDLTKVEAIIKGTDTSLTKINYYSDSSLNAEILTPTAFIKKNPTDEIVYAKVTSNTYNCTEVAQITLQTISSTLSSAISAPPIINDFSGNGNSVTLIAPSSGGPFEYSLDGINYQDSPLFTNLSARDYTANIRDKSNCEYLEYPITLLDYPRFFTPNGDTNNDVWGIKNLYLYPKASINIFDRYGKLLKNMDATSSWDGKYIGNDLPADDYWFHLNLDDGRIIKGHFTLKR